MLGEGNADILAHIGAVGFLHRVGKLIRELRPELPAGIWRAARIGPGNRIPGGVGNRATDAGRRDHYAGIVAFPGQYVMKQGKDADRDPDQAEINQKHRPARQQLAFFDPPVNHALGMLGGGASFRRGKHGILQMASRLSYNNCSFGRANKAGPYHRITQLIFMESDSR